MWSNQVQMTCRKILHIGIRTNQVSSQLLVKEWEELALHSMLKWMWLLFNTCSSMCGFFPILHLWHEQSFCSIRIPHGLLCSGMSILTFSNVSFDRTYFFFHRWNGIIEFLFWNLKEKWKRRKIGFLPHKFFPLTVNS